MRAFAFDYLQGNHSAVKSPDEYSIIIESQRGPKEFQFDQVFMPEVSQDKIFEDANVSDSFLTDTEWNFCQRYV